MGYFGYILGDTSVYTKFVYLLDALMGIASKVLMDEFKIDILAHTFDAW